MFGQYKRIRNEFSGTLTGKGINWGGSLIRPEATGYGAVYFAEEMLRSREDGFEGKVCAVSGSGNVAQFTTEKLIELGAKVVTLSDSQGTVHDPSGINREKLEFVMTLKNVQRGRIREYADTYGVEFIEGGKPWHVPCQCAFPSATENEIDGEDAAGLLANGCMLVCEGANMPSTPEAVDLYRKQGILYGPGKAANAGGVAVSGLEMSQNAMRLSWTREEVDRRLQDIMRAIHGQCYQTADEYGREGDLVTGANIAGFIKVADAMIEQGLV